MFFSVEVSAPDSTTSDKDRPEIETELVKTKTSEAERIAEYLTRGDTAVIFPEPVRDDQDTQIDEGRCLIQQLTLKDKDGTI